MSKRVKCKFSGKKGEERTEKVGVKGSILLLRILGEQ